MRGRTRLLFVALLACSKTVAVSPPSFPVNEAARTSSLVGSDGGTLVAPTGDRLVIPSGALSSSATITMTPLAIPSTAGIDFLGGVYLEPDNLAFTKSLTLTLALAFPMTRGTQLRSAIAVGDMSQFGTAFGLFTVDDAGTTATGTITGFSGHATQINSHAGTRNHLVNAWSGNPTRDLNTRAQALGLDASVFTTTLFDPSTLQDLIGPQMGVCGNAGPGAAIGSGTTTEIRGTLEGNQQVVFLFGENLQQDVTTGKWRNVNHSAAGVLIDGGIYFRNQLNVTNPATLQQLDQEATVLTVPLSEIEPDGGVRRSRDGEAYLRHIKKMSDAEIEAYYARRATSSRVWSHVVVLCEHCPDAGTKNRDICDGGTYSTGYGPSDGCNAGKCYDLGSLTCQQKTCPAGVGRNYSYACMCEWPKVATYERCTGLMTSCQ